MNNSSKLIFIGSNLVLVSKLRSFKGFELEIVKPKSLESDFEIEGDLSDAKLVLFDLEACRKEEALDKALATADRCRKSKLMTIAFYPHVYTEYREFERSFDQLIVKGSVVQVLKKLLCD